MHRPNATVWKVESDLLVLDSLKPTTYEAEFARQIETR